MECSACGFDNRDGTRITPHGVQPTSDGEQITNHFTGQLLGTPNHTFRAIEAPSRRQGRRVTARKD